MTARYGEERIPLIDVRPLIDARRTRGAAPPTAGTPTRDDDSVDDDSVDDGSVDDGTTVDRAPVGQVAESIREACRESGFFYVTGHAVSESLQSRLEALSRQFFAQPEALKMQLRMELGGEAWRGYFPVGNELTAGKPDQKEGLYFGAELSPDDARVAARWPLHGPNLFPPLEGFRNAVLEYINAMTELGHVIMEGIALSLGLEAGYFSERYTADPLVLFRIFHYPSLEASENALDNETSAETLWSVGEHTDYGLLTLLKQDDRGGLQVKSAGRWIEAPPVDGTFVCNIGDMLDRMTAGFYRSTPHRVRNRSEHGRLSFPFFFDPNFEAKVEPIRMDVDPEGTDIVADGRDRWDKLDIHAFRGTYGDYVLQKVSQVFPGLAQRTGGSGDRPWATRSE